jgi:hypothetical protein
LSPQSIISRTVQYDSSQIKQEKAWKHDINEGVKEPTRGKEQVTYKTINMLIGRTRVSRTRVSRIERGSRNEYTAIEDGEDDENDARW